MTDTAPRKFEFDTVFDGAGAIASQAPRPKRLFTAEEVEKVRAEAYASGERKALASMKALQAQALAGIGNALAGALNTLAVVAHEHRTHSAELSLACARAIADAALDRFPHAPVQAAMESLAREIESAPRLVVSAPADMVEGLQEILDETAQTIGYAGAIQVRATPGMPPAAFTFDFGDGSAAFDPQAAAARVAAALDAALAAEGLHAEPLTPGSES
jgi:flagellar assembly protein FliH